MDHAVRADRELIVVAEEKVVSRDPEWTRTSQFRYTPRRGGGDKLALYFPKLALD